MDERLGSLLLQARKVREDQLEEALRRQRQRGGRLGTNLVELGALPLDVLAAALSAQRRVPLATANELELAASEALRLLPASTASQLLAIPLSVGAAGVVVAVASPWDPAVAQALSAAIGRPLLLKVAPELRVFDALERLYRLPHPRRVVARVAAADAGAIPGLEPIVAALPSVGPLASALAPSLDVDVTAVAPVEELSGDLFVDVAELVDPPAPPPAPAAPAPSPAAVLPLPRPDAPSAPLPRLKTPVPLAPVGLGDPLASMSWDVAPGGPPPRASCPPWRGAPTTPGWRKNG